MYSNWRNTLQFNARHCNMINNYTQGLAGAKTANPNAFIPGR
jgi:hypothetical protein